MDEYTFETLLNDKITNLYHNEDLLISLPYLIDLNEDNKHSVLYNLLESLKHSINCLYCNEILEYTYCPNFLCEKCGVSIASYNGEITMIDFNLSNYIIELDLIKSISILYADYKPVLSLPYLININPNNKQYWLDKLLKLTTFI